MSSTFAPLCVELKVVFYRAMHEAPTTFMVTLDKGWFIFGRNFAFYQKTLFPLLAMSVYDAEFKLFVPLLATGGLLVNSELHPWVIIRSSYLEDGDCPGLERCIRQLMAARTDARKKRIAQIGFGYTGIGTARWISAMANGEFLSGNSITEGNGDVDDIGTVVESDADEGPDIRVIVVFGGDDDSGDDADDSDYSDSASEDGGNKEKEGMSKEGAGEEREGTSKGKKDMREDGATEMDDEVMETEEEAVETDGEATETDSEEEATD